MHGLSHAGSTCQVITGDKSHLGYGGQVGADISVCMTQGALGEVEPG